MAKRIFAPLLGILACSAVSGVVSAEAGAETVAVRVDGCAVLARAVYSEVAAATLYGPGRSGPWLIESGQGDISICSTAAKTVSRAFTSAMTSAGYVVYWDGSLINPGEFCPGAYLSRCHPNRDGRLTSNYSADNAFVQKTWSIVSQSVMRQMHNRFSSDEVRFRDSELKLQLGLSLRTISARALL